MKQTCYRYVCFLLPLLFGPAGALFSQPSAGGTPRSLNPEFAREYGERPLRAVQLKKVDLKTVLSEDKKGPATRFTVPLSVDLGLANAGHWTRLEDGALLWRLKVRSPGALALAFLYDEFYLPPGATLFMYSEDGAQILGAYTHHSNLPNGKFMTGLIEGESAVLEYHEPASAAGQGRIHLFRVDHAYRKDFPRTATPRFNSPSSPSFFGFGAAQPCYHNINCPQGAKYQDQKRSVCRIIVVVQQGMGFCTGTLVNNTRQDGAPLLLSAFHCQDGFTPLYDFWRFDFNYEGVNCENPLVEPEPNSILGCRRLAGRRENDFLLLELSAAIPTGYGVYFSGWNRRETPPDSAVSIHHPLGDVKKLSLMRGKITVFNARIEWDNDVVTPPSHHFDVPYTFGTFELGSSGSALIDPEGRVVGQLHGGNASCPVTSGYFGRLSMAWEGGGTPETRLKDWLDPLGAAPLAIDGMNTAEGVGTLAGRIRMENGKSVAGARVELTGAAQAGMFTDADGHFQFDELSLGEVYTLNFIKNDDYPNGLSTLDLILIRKHILGLEKLGSPYQMIAADVNLSNSITTLDLILIQKVILGVDLAFPNAPSWRFIPADYEFPDPANPFQSMIPPVYPVANFGESRLDIDIVGVKLGDVNHSATPSQ
jgi:lysyl endopeptidase